MSLFKKHLAEYTCDTEQKEDEQEIIAEDTHDQPEDGYLTTEASDEDEVAPLAEKEAEPEDELVEEIVEEVKEAVEDVVADLVAFLKSAKAPKHVMAAALRKLRLAGVLVNTPEALSKMNLSKIAFSKKDVQLVDKAVTATLNSVETILKKSAQALRKAGRTVKHAKSFDKMLLEAGYLRSTVAKPTKIESNKRQAEAQKPARKNKHLSFE